MKGMKKEDKVREMERERGREREGDVRYSMRVYVEGVNVAAEGGVGSNFYSF